MLPGGGFFSPKAMGRPAMGHGCIGIIGLSWSSTHVMFGLLLKMPNIFGISVFGPSIWIHTCQHLHAPIAMSGPQLQDLAAWQRSIDGSEPTSLTDSKWVAKICSSKSSKVQSKITNTFRELSRHVLTRWTDKLHQIAAAQALSTSTGATVAWRIRRCQSPSTPTWSSTLGKAGWCWMMLDDFSVSQISHCSPKIPNIHVS